MAVSGIALTTPIVLSISPVLAAPLLPPQWIVNLLNDQKRSGLTQGDINKLKQLANGSYKTLASLLQRINGVASTLGLSFRFKMALVGVPVGNTGKMIEPSYGDTITLKIQVVDDDTGKVIATYVIGMGTYDVGQPPNPNPAPGLKI